MTCFSTGVLLLKCVCVPRLAEGEQILTGGVLNKQKSQDDIVTEFGDSSCFTLALLGQIYWCVSAASLYWIIHTHSQPV